MSIFSHQGSVCLLTAAISRLNRAIIIGTKAYQHKKTWKRVSELTFRQLGSLACLLATAQALLQ
jgi:hypothetical protein